MTEEEAKAAVIVAAEALITIGVYGKNDGFDAAFAELKRCVTQYRTYQRRVFLVAHGEAANISLVVHNGVLLLDYPAGEFTMREAACLQRFRTALVNDPQVPLAQQIMLLLPVFWRLERVGPWPDGI